MWHRTTKKARITRLAFATALLIGLSLLALRSLPSAHAHEGRKHESPKETPAASTAQSAPLAEPAHQTPEHENPDEEAPGATPAHPYPPEGVPRPLAWLGKFHPPAVNFPIAMLTAAALSELLL